MVRQSTPSGRTESNRASGSQTARPAGPAGQLRLDSGEAGLVLLVDDEPLLSQCLKGMLETDGHRVELAADRPQLDHRLGDLALTVVLVDLSTGRRRGRDLLDRVKRDCPGVEVIVMAAHASIEGAVECMRRGAFDYLAKPFEDPQRVRVAVKQAVERVRQVRHSRRFGIATDARPLFSERAWAPARADSLHSLRDLPLSLDAYEKSVLERTLREVSGDARAAARELGVGRSTLYRKLAKHGLTAGRVAAARPSSQGAGLGAVHPIG